jgi:hypothetical protein
MFFYLISQFYNFYFLLINMMPHFYLFNSILLLSTHFSMILIFFFSVLMFMLLIAMSSANAITELSIDNLFIRLSIYIVNSFGAKIDPYITPLPNSYLFIYTHLYNYLIIPIVSLLYPNFSSIENNI